MTAYIFQNILEDAIQQNIVPNREQESKNWFRDQAKTINIVNRQKLFRVGNENIRNKLRQFDIGRMFMFFYDPKFKKKLKYYDRFPLILPVDIYSQSMTALNLHYLPYKTRALFFDELYNITNNNNFDNTTRFRLTYSMLKYTQKFKEFKPCFKRYLYNHKRSTYLYIEPNQWDIALFLRTDMFIKSNRNVVWKDSKQIFRFKRKIKEKT